MYLPHNDTLTLKMSLREWLLAMMHQASDRSLVATRRFGHMLYSRRGLKLKEFTELMSAENFASAICNLRWARF